MKEFIEFIKVIVWPLVVAGALVGFYQQIARFLDELGRRATKVSVYQVAFELATVPEFAPSWSIGSIDVRGLSSADIFDSVADTLFKQLMGNVQADYAIVDLGEGKQWLTSRLFIFAVVLERLRGLRSFVFLERCGGVRRRFVGVASPDQVRWALARHYPWLEAAFAQAYSSVTPYDPRQRTDPYIFSDPYAFSDPNAPQLPLAKQLVRSFLHNIQQNQDPPPDQMESWESFTTQAGKLWERANWLDGERLERDLQGVLQTSWLLDSPDIASSRRTEAILRREGHFVALVEESGRFRRLVDRQAILEQVASKMGIPPGDRPSAQ
jgi:hypothetical protein